MAVRALAWAIVLIVVVYHGLRLALAQCAGASCDAYSPLTLLLPLAAVVLAGVTGALAAYEARARPSWSLVLAACAIVAVAGPVIAAIALSDNDAKVLVSTVLVLTVPVALGVRSWWRPTRIT